MNSYQVIDPATEQPVSTVEQLDAEATDAAIDRRVTSPGSEDAEMGPLISQAQRTAVRSFVEDADEDVEISFRARRRPERGSGTRRRSSSRARPPTG